MGLIKEIKQVVNEELGISQEVKEHVDNIFKLIINDAKSKVKYPGLLISYPYVKTGKLIYNIQYFRLLEITVYYKILYLKDLQEFNNTDYVAGEQWVDENHLILQTTIIYDKSKNKYIDYEGSLQHEFEHVFQEIKSGKQILSNQTSKKIYTTAVTLIDSGKKFESLVGYVVYYANRFERDAFVNDTYKIIMGNESENPYSVLKNTITYKNIKAIKYAVIDNDNRQKIEPIVKSYFNKSYNWFYNMAVKTVKEYTNKMGKMMVKVINDIAAENEKKGTLDGGRLPVKGISINDSDL